MRMYADERDLSRIFPLAGTPLRGVTPAPQPVEDPLLQLQRTVGNRGVQAAVRIHDDEQAAASAQAADAEAFTTGRDIYFGAGRFRPDLPSGRRLLLHEMAHVAQQRNPGPYASRHALEAEADRTAAHAAAGRAAPVRLSAPPGQRQHKTINWKFGDITVNAEAARQIKTVGGLFSGNDQAHVAVDTKGRLGYDADHTAPEDPFRWSRLKELVDGAHLKIFAVSSSEKFKVLVKGKVIDESIDSIRTQPGSLGAMGIALPVGVADGPGSPDPTYGMIYYDKDQGLGALTHELFGHAWLRLKSAPWEHPPQGSAEEKTRGTLTRKHGITDAFGNIHEGTVADYIQKNIESLGSSTQVMTAGGATITVPKSPTQGVGREAVARALKDLHAEAQTGLKKTIVGNQKKTTYSGRMAQIWRTLTSNYNLMPRNRDAVAAGNPDLTYTQEVVLGICYLLFESWTADQKDAFRILLADFTAGRVGWYTSELTSRLEALVGAAPSIYKAP
jgi:hypothetical protein